MITKGDEFVDLTGNGSPLHPHKGLTKREYFAAMAMQGLCSYGDGESNISNESAPILAVQMADALIAALNKEVEK